MGPLIGSLLLGGLMGPYFGWLGLAALGAVTLAPAMGRLMRWTRLRPAGAAALLTLGMAACLLLPVALIAATAVKGAVGQVKALRASPVWEELRQQQGGDEASRVHLAQWPKARAALERLGNILPVSPEDLGSAIEEGAKTSLSKLGDFLGEVLTALPGFFTGLVIFTIALFFFLSEGPAWVEAFRCRAPMERELLNTILHRLTVLSRSVVGASLLSGSAQASLFVLGLLIVGVPQPLTLGLAALVSSLIPLVGASPVTFGTALVIALTQGGTAAWILGGFALLTSVIDNLIRPWVLGAGEAKLPTLLAFLSVFAGIQIFGVAGIFLGPIVAGLALLAWEMGGPDASFSGDAQNAAGRDETLPTPPESATSDVR